MPRIGSTPFAFPDFRGATRRLVLWNLAAYFALALALMAAPAAADGLALSFAFTATSCVASGYSIPFARWILGVVCAGGAASPPHALPPDQPAGRTSTVGLGRAALTCKGLKTALTRLAIFGSSSKTPTMRVFRNGSCPWTDARGDLVNSQPLQWYTHSK